MKTKMFFYVRDVKLHELFSPIRNMVDVMISIIDFCLILLDDSNFTEKNGNYNIELVVDTMSRIYIFKDHSFYSIGFPLSISPEKSLYAKDILLDLQILYGAKSILTNLNGNSVRDSYEDLHDTNIPENSLFLLEYLLFKESCYIRYDIDYDREKRKKHPKNHLDIHYSQHGTYKLGLSKQLLKDDFVDIMDNNTDCWFLRTLP